MAFCSVGIRHHGTILGSGTTVEVSLVGIDYFTKWMEAEAMTTITKKNVQSFVWRYIIYRYGIPRVLILDNEKQFDNNSFRDFCS